MKHVAVVLTIAAVAIPMASAKGKPPLKGEGCKPKVTVILKGKLTSDPGDGTTSFTMDVTGTNAHGKQLKGLGVTVALDAKTKVRRQGAKTAESLAMNDRANVQLLRCKADLPLTAETADDVPAARVTAQAAKA
jgi:hypothetical protein